MIKVGLLTEIIAPYRIPVFNCLAAVPGIDLEVVFLAESESRRAWSIPKEDIRFAYKVLQGRIIGRTYQDAPLYLNLEIIRHLAISKYDIIITGGYQHPTYWLALLYAKVTRKRVLLWSESTRKDGRSGNSLKEAFKGILINGYCAHIVPGTPQKEYLEDFNIPGDRIFTAPNAIDNTSFIERSRSYRENKAALKIELGIIGPIVLYVGRLVEEKGVRDLLAACDVVRKELELTLLVVGSGPDQASFETAACAAGSAVRFIGFQQQEMLPKFYSLADLFVMPTYSDPWGLVINEAMACGLPIISSTAAGAARDLVRDGENGYLFEPGDREALAQHIGRALRDLVHTESMGGLSREIIEQYSPKKCAEGFAKALFNNAKPKKAQGI